MGRRISRGQGWDAHEEANALRSCRWLAVSKAKRQRDRFAWFKAILELAAKLLRVVWGVWRSRAPYDPLRTGGLRRQAR